jgi:hypothetical protein
MRLIPTLTLAAAASALPNPSPKLSKSTGFHLVAHVTNPAHDLTPSVEGWSLAGIHTGAGFNAAVLDASASSGRLFYQNGTVTQVARRQATVVTDGGTPPFPMSLQVQAPGEPRQIAGINVAQGTPGRVDVRGVLVNGLAESRGGTYLACRQTVPYYGVEYATLQYAYGGEAEGVADGCAPIKLVARCAVLNELPEGSISSHEFVQEVRCVE